MNIQNPESLRPSTSISSEDSSFEALFRRNSLPMWILNANTWRFIEANQKTIDLFGYSREELLSMSLRNLMPIDDVALDIETLLNEDASVGPPTWQHLCKNGTLLHLEVSTQRIRFNGTDAVLAVGVDVSKQCQIEDALFEANRKFRSIFEYAVEGIYQILPSGRFLTVNPSFARMLGYDSPEDLCRNLVDAGNQLYVRPHLRTQFMDLLEKNNVARALEYEAYRKDRSIIWISVNVRTVRDEKGHVLFFEGTAEDVTQRKLSEESLRLLNESLERHTQELARSNTELQQFAYAASHDLQEPLRMVSSYLHLVAMRYRGRLDREADEFIHFAVDGAKRMKLLIDDLLAYSRVGRRDNERLSAGCEELVAQAVKNLFYSIQETGAEVTFDPLPVVVGARVQLVQLFQNLIGNAIKFRGTTSPKVHIRAKLRGGEWVFEVSDNGIGFEMEYSDRIFRIFQRLHSREKYPGTGVGLAICRKIVECHGGLMWVESKPDRGSSFFFTLPAISDDCISIAALETIGSKASNE